MLRETFKKVSAALLGLTTAAVMTFVVSVPNAGAAREETDMSGLLGGSSNLSDLFVISALFDDEDGVFNGDNGLDLGGDINLEDLVVLEALMGDDGGVLGGSGGGQSNLGDLIILEALFNDGEDGSGLNLGDGGDGTDIGDLIILEALFNDGLTSGVIGGRRTVVVESGDTLSGIAEEFLGDASRFDEIAELNDIEDPDVIFPGQRLRLPADGGGVGTGNILGDSNLGDLIVLSELFNDGDDTDLKDLIILQEVFDNRQ